MKTLIIKDGQRVAERIQRRLTIISVFIISILFIYIVGHFFTKKVIEPVKEMTGKAVNISVKNLNLRLTSNGNKHELSVLANYGLLLQPLLPS